MKKKKVLVTGGCGLIGREVVKQLIQKGYFVVVVDDFRNLKPLVESSHLSVINFDLTKSEGILEIFRGVDYCIHLAARVGGIKYMNLFQSEILKDNILIDTNVISAASLMSIKLVYASTVIVYDQSKKLPFTEDQFLPAPKSYYGFSKLVGEKLCQSYGEDKKLPYLIARICNVYGVSPNKISKEKLHVIPDLVRKISKRGKLQLIGGGRQTRTFIHVSDVANALILMMESQTANGEIFNVASSEKYQILELAEMIWNLLKPNETFSFENIDFKGQDLINSLVDASKISKALGWKAKISLKENLPEIVRWYQTKYEREIF